VSTPREALTPHSESALASVAALQQEIAALRAQLATAQLEAQEYREQLKLRDLALDATPTQFTINKQDDSGLIMVYCNQAVATQHGFTRDELIGKSPVRIAPKWSPERFEEVAAELMAGREVRSEDEIIRKDGSSYWRGFTLRSVMDENGKRTYMVGVGADITQKREAQLKQRELQEQLIEEMKERERILIELRTAQKLESVGRLAAGVAHEINTPIQYVNDSLYFLRDSFADISKLVAACRNGIDAQMDIEQLHQTVSQVADAIDLEFLQLEIPKAFERTFEGAERVANIVRAMKEFSHPDATEFSSADLNHAIQTTLTVASNEYKYLAVVQTQFAELPPVICNVGEINQVFLNLVVNAAHAIHDAGKDLSTGVISISTTVDGDYVEIAVSDNGCGIPQENLDKIYDPFFTTKEVGRGTGQGLAITRSIIVDKHGGQVEAHSQVGVGTQFKLRLPIAGRRGGPGV